MMEKPDVFSVPRRFDLVTVLVAMSCFAALFAGLRMMDARPELLAIFGGYLIAVAIGQGIAARWNRPRTASVLVGIVLAFGFGIWEMYAWRRGWNRPGQLMEVGIWAVMWGSFIGYLAGTLVGGIFLVSHYLREWTGLGKRRSTAQQAESESPWEEKHPLDE